jgi:hypothetical protein
MSVFLPFKNVTHRLDGLFIDVLVSVTLAGAVARSFDVHSGMTANVAGVGTSTASDEADTWGEFGRGRGCVDDLASPIPLGGGGTDASFPLRICGCPRRQSAVAVSKHLAPQ